MAEATDQNGSTTPVPILRQVFAVVLAGGEGNRLKHLTRWRAKPAVPFGGKYRIIDFPLSNCVNSGISRVAVLTQYKAQSLIRHLQRAWNFLRHEVGEFIEIVPAQQRMGKEWYLGTADAVAQNLDLLRRHRPRYILILAGDHVYTMDYARMLASHVERRAEITIACIPVPLAQASHFGVMAVDEENRVVCFVEKPSQPEPIPGQPEIALASMGIYLFDAEYLYALLLEDRDRADSTHDFGRDLIPYALQRGDRLFAYRFVNEAGKPDYWRDVGTIESYWRANMDLCAIEPPLNLYDRNWPIWTYQAQRPPAKFAFDDEGRRGMAVDSLVSAGCILSGAVARRSVLFTNTFLHSYSTVEESVLLPNVEVGRHAKIRRAIIDKHCRIPPGMEIGFDREADRERFYCCPQSGLVVVTPEMLGQSFRHYDPQEDF
ncbi:glucose-1-phosphate adenylyltransferase [Hydrogenophilus thiooxidans]|uniref:glucose-1-phosphate adenylyltransferase n=1 Tax=Hydrogenophilus thiooxidans TaxID=2820326 RepID=UPI001C250F93|nr:glucose-1-phosphate adenylyltransferase [Hydrogenophilus thiooxidans]